MKKYEEALDSYNVALQQNITNNELKAICYSNRSAVNLSLGNNGKVIEDCLKAIEYDGKNLKAHWRIACAYFKLEKYSECKQFCTSGLCLQPENKELNELMQKTLQKMNDNEEQKNRILLEKKQMNSKLEQRWKELQMEFDKRGIVMGCPIFGSQQQYQGDVYKDENDVLHWPVLFLYEEHNQSDFVKDFNENHTFQEHLSYMFQADNLPTWDVEHKYIPSNLEIYTPLGVSTPIKTTTKSYKKRWIKIKQTTTLKTVLSHVDYVVPQYPVFYVLVSNSLFKEEFLKRSND